MGKDRQFEAKGGGEQGKRQQADPAEAASDDDQEEREEVSEEAFDSFLTAILMTPVDELPPVPKMPETEEERA